MGLMALADIRRGRTLTYRDAPVVFTDHAIRRAAKRHYRRMNLDAVREQLSRDAAEYGVVKADAPAWVGWRDHPDAMAWLMLGDLMAFPMISHTSEDGAIVCASCLTPQETVGAEVHWR